ncbi:hypothetical protein [Thermococcus waiotapuensis]|uniref:Uncharacterized protein n=1 Tax=Thermococcus waiotapuensis TaxID=90909 RepID=A0AAE4NTI2_9EURY|nr:hypothetical protein [Thermococcus waiotapuensis]MDV3103002.1 hypothetical protein [Thermococcus waiotapuensis]
MVDGWKKGKAHVRRAPAQGHGTVKPMFPMDNVFLEAFPYSVGILDFEASIQAVGRFNLALDGAHHYTLAKKFDPDFDGMDVGRSVPRQVKSSRVGVME